MGGVGALGLGEVGPARPSQQRDGDVAEGRHDLRGGPGADLAAVFAEGHVADPVQAVLDPPVTPPQRQQLSRPGLLGGQAGDGVCDFGPRLSVLRDGTGQPQHLLAMRPALRLGQGRADEEFAAFHAVAVPRRLGRRTDG